MLGRTGLVCLSIALAAGLLLLVRRVVRHSTPSVRALAAAVLFYLFVWLSPQLYYIYYLMIFDDLPDQWVVGPPPAALEIIRLLFFVAQNDLSHHGQGVLAWVLLVAALWPQRNPARI